MYKINPPAVYIRQCVLDDRSCVRRMERMMRNINTKKVGVISDEDLQELAIMDLEDKAYRGKRSHDTNSDMEDPVVIFGRSTIDNWVGIRKIQENQEKECIRENEGLICQGGYEISCAKGCLHKCAYCWLTKSIHIKLDLENYPKNSLDAMVLI